MCPPERTVLDEFYQSAKGGEWTESQYWSKQQNDHCSWHGVTCEGGFVVKLILANNGLSGKLNSRISELRSLEVLDLNDNNIQVCVSCYTMFYLSLWLMMLVCLLHSSPMFSRAPSRLRLASFPISPFCASHIIHLLEMLLKSSGC